MSEEMTEPDSGISRNSSSPSRSSSSSSNSSSSSSSSSSIGRSSSSSPAPDQESEVNPLLRLLQYFEEDKRDDILATAQAVMEEWKECKNGAKK